MCFTQTDYRESEVQTDPCTLDFVYDYKDVLPEVSALESLHYDHGLPTRTHEDLEVVEGLRLIKAGKERLPTVGDPRRSIAQNRLIENQSNVSKTTNETGFLCFEYKFSLPGIQGFRESDISCLAVAFPAFPNRGSAI